MAGGVVAWSPATTRRLVISAEPHFHAGHGLSELFMTTPAAPEATVGVCVDRGVDDLGLEGAYGRFAKSQAIGRADDEILMKDVHPLDQLSEHGQTLWGLQVKENCPLAVIDVRVRAAAVRVPVRPRVIDLDHVRAILRQHARCRGASKDLGQIEDTYALQSTDCRRCAGETGRYPWLSLLRFESLQELGTVSIETLARSARRRRRLAEGDRVARLSGRAKLWVMQGDDAPGVLGMPIVEPLLRALA